MGARPASSRAAILAESLGGERLGGAEGGEVPGVGRPGGERAIRAAGRGERGRRRQRRPRRGGAAAAGSSSPVPSPPPAELEPGRGGVRGAGPGRELLRVRPERTRGASARRLAGTLRRRRRCGGRREVHERREGGAESGGCPVRRLLESPGGGERRARQARGGGPSGVGEQPGARSLVRLLARPGAARLLPGRPAAAGGERG